MFKLFSFVAVCMSSSCTCLKCRLIATEVIHRLCILASEQLCMLVAGDRRSLAGPTDALSDEAAETVHPASHNDDDEHSMSWSSVEMVAVNQAILSLTGQQPIDVAVPPGFLRSLKTESLGDHDDEELDTPPPPPTVDSA